MNTRPGWGTEGVEVTSCYYITAHSSHGSLACNASASVVASDSVSFRCLAVAGNSGSLSERPVGSKRSSGGRRGLYVYSAFGIVPPEKSAVRYNVSQRAIMSTTMVHVRVDEKTKQRATKTLAAMGMSVSDAVRMLLVRVVAEKALPFDVKIPNATTVKAMRAADKGQGKRPKSPDALFKDLGI